MKPEAPTCRACLHGRSDYGHFRLTGLNQIHAFFMHQPIAPEHARGEMPHSNGLRANPKQPAVCSSDRMTAA
jgi:hypothetical protein